MAIIRAFIAIELTPELKHKLFELEAQLKKNMPPVIKWVDPESMHITLKFLGETSDAGIDELLLAMKEAVTGTAHFQLELGRLGAFPAVDRPHLFWIGLNGEMDKLNQLQKTLEENTELLGFKRENRAFSPHLSLGRVRDEARPGEVLRIGKLLSETALTDKQSINVSTISLMKSVLTPAGPIYSCLGRVKLG